MLIHDPSLHRLGRKPKRVDPRTYPYERLRLATTNLLPPRPALCNWLDGIADFGEMLNADLGDCTCAAAGHLIQCWTASNGEPELTLSDQAILEAYEAVGGYVVGRPDTDNGAVELDVLNYWRTTGIGGRKIDAFAAVNVHNAEHVREALWLYGGLYIGLSLPVSAQNQDVWDVPAEGLTGDGAPGSWGGHAVCVMAYDADHLTCITWGAPKLMTNAFWSAYADECYAVLSPDWIASGRAPSGFDVTALSVDLPAVG